MEREIFEQVIFVVLLGPAGFGVILFGIFLLIRLFQIIFKK